MKRLILCLALLTPFAASAQQITPPGGTCSTATTSAVGCVQPDGTSITINGSGVITASGGSATQVTIGTTVVSGGANGNLLDIASGKIGALSLGTGVSTALGNATGATGGFVTFSGALGTPTSGTATNLTGLPISTGVSGLGTGVATALAANVTGSGNIVLATSPTLVTPALGTPASGTLTNTTGLPISTGVSGLGTGVATALAAGVTGSGNIVLATSPTIASPTLSGTVAGAGTIPNAVLVNSSMTLAGHSVSLGGTQTFACADLSNGATGCSTATGTSGATIPLLNGTNTWSGPQTFGTNDLVLTNATSGSVTLAPVTGALGAVTASLPANTGTIAETNLSQTFSATQTFSGTANVSGTFQLGGNTLATGGALTFANMATANDVLYVSSSGNVGQETLSSAIDTAFGSAQGDILYRGSSGWTVLAPGTSGYFLETQGSSANPTWAAASGGSGCTVSGGAQYQILVNNGSSGCSSDANASANAGALALGASGTAGSVAMGNATSGVLTLQPATGALGTVTVSIPAATDTLVNLASTQTLSNKTLASPTVTGAFTATGLVTNADLANSSMTLAGHSVSLGGTQTFACADLSNGATGCSTATGTSGATIPLLNGTNTWSGAQTFGTNDLVLTNATSGSITVAPVTGALGSVTVSFPANTGTLAELNLAQSWTAVQTFSASGIRLLGSSTGYTTFASANSSATNYTLTVPAATDTIDVLGTAQTFTAAKTFTNSDLLLLGSSTGATTFTSANASGTAYTATVPANTGTLAELNLAQTWSAAQTFNTNDLVLTNATSGSITVAPVTGALGTVTASLPANTGTIAELNLAQTWTAPQRGSYQTPTISTATFTPAIGTAQNIRINLTSACPCTLANPSGTLVAGQQGMIEIAQDGTGSRTIGTYGTDYEYAGGTSTITLSTAANAVDYIPYAVDSTATYLVLGGIIKSPTH